MRWLILTNSPYMNGGTQTLTRELARAVAERGWPVDFLCFQANPYHSLSVEFSGECTFHEAPALNTRSLRPRDVLVAFRELRRIAPDVLFMCNSGVPDFLPFMFAAQWAGVSRVVVHQGTDVGFPPEMERRRRFGIIPGLGLWRKELIASCRCAFRGASLVLCNNSEQMANWCRAMRIPKAKSSLWYPPIDLSQCRRDARIREQVRAELGVAGAFVIGCVGHLNEQKSFDVAVRAMAVMREEVTDAVLLIAGEGPKRTELEQLIRSEGLEGRVRLLGNCLDVPRLMNAFDAFCLPSTLAHETLGLVILEAMASEVPVVVSDLPGPARLADSGRCAIVCPRGDHDALAGAFLRVYRDPEHSRTLIANATASVQECERGRVLDQILEILRVGARENSRELQ